MNHRDTIFAVLKFALGTSLAIGAAGAGGCASPNDPMKVPPPPAEVPYPPPLKYQPLAPALQDAARNEILAALQSDDPVIRSNAIEAMRDAWPGPAEKYVLAALNDPSAEVRFAACMAAGELKLAAAHDTLLRLHDDEDRNVRLSAIFALHKLGDTRFSHELEKDAADYDAVTRGATAMILGLLGEPTGANLLVALQHDMIPAVRLQADEAMWRLGNPDGLDALVADTISRYPDDQIIGVIGLAEPRDERVAGHVSGMLTSDFPEVSLAAARAMGMLGYDSGYWVAVQGARSKDPRQRFLAAMAFGAIGRCDTQQFLSILLKDDAPTVRLGAAMALLQLKPPADQASGASQ